MTIKDFINATAKKLKTVGVESARLDCLVLLEDITGKDRAWLLAHPEVELESEKVKKLGRLVERRANHEPLAYIRGRSEFYGREFLVTADTLQPRPETEAMIEMAIQLIENEKLKVENIIDVGTGTGCIAISMKLEQPDIRVLATDISRECLDISQTNAQTLGAKIELLEGDLLEPISPSTYQSSTIILANLPYVPDNHPINQAAQFEPALALFAGDDGLDAYRKMFKQINQLVEKPKAILTESLTSQHQALRALANEHGFTLESTKDLIQRFSLNE